MDNNNTDTYQPTPLELAIETGTCQDGFIAVNEDGYCIETTLEDGSSVVEVFHKKRDASIAIAEYIEAKVNEFLSCSQDDELFLDQWSVVDVTVDADGTISDEHGNTYKASC